MLRIACHILKPGQISVYVWYWKLQYHFESTRLYDQISTITITGFKVNSADSNDTPFCLFSFQIIGLLLFIRLRQNTLWLAQRRRLRRLLLGASLLLYVLTFKKPIFFSIPIVIYHYASNVNV